MPPVTSELNALDGAALEELLARLDDDGRIVHVERWPARPPRFGDLDMPLAHDLIAALTHDRFFTHQAEAINRLRRGESVAVATGTASGKSLCYQVPIAEAALESAGRSTALLLFPTKALAQDQLRSLAGLGLDAVRPATFDGDTPREHRSFVRNRMNTILTNPEMLHGTMLPNHGQWRTFFRNLRYVVIDELHVLRGVFGTHVSHILRRLLRVARHYGSEPVFCFTSATIGEPAALASELCGLPVAQVDDDGAPTGPRTFALLNPPLVDEASGARTSTTSETSSAIAALVDSGHRTIAFAQSRKGTELIAGDVRRRVNALDPDIIRSYRGGYLASERREIEDELATGKVSAVVATNALELGIDIGDLDACVLSGFPGTIASMWQQAGRAGRQGQRSLTILVAGDDQLDQWLMAHPDQVFSRPPEPAVINVTNPFIAEPHLGCAAYELPLGHHDHEFWPDTIDDAVRDLVLDDLCVVRNSDDGPVALWSGAGRPSRGMGLRSGSANEFSIVDLDGTLIGTVDESRAPRLVHEGAIYLHRGETFRVVEYDPERLTSIVDQTDADEYTQPSSDTSITVLGIDDKQSVGPLELHLGRVEVTTLVTGYQRRQRRTKRVIANEKLALDPQRLATRAFWYTLGLDLCFDAGVAMGDLPGALHAAEHAMIGMLPLFTICDRWDVGGVSTAMHADTGHPSIFIYDGYPGGTGIAELGYEVAGRHLSATLELLRRCGCAEGCPSCIVSPKCGNGNEPLDKSGAITLLALAG
ncbi:MAG: DEAD/DEAH box helicase [Actinomycetota bacterium]